MKDVEKTHIGKLLKAHRRSLRPRPDQSYIAEQTGMSTVWLQKVEQGRVNPSLEALLRLGEVMGIDSEGMDRLIDKSTYLTSSSIQRTLYLTHDENNRLRALATNLGVGDRELMRKFIQEGLERSNQI